MKLLKYFPELGRLSLEWPDLLRGSPIYPPISHDGLKHIVQLNLRLLVLKRFPPTKKTIAILNQLAQRPTKKQIVFQKRIGREMPWLASPRIEISLSHKSTDDDLKLIGKLHQLYSLTIFSSPKVTDAGLKYLGNSKRLMSLSLYGTNVTDEALQVLQTILPNLKHVTNKNPVMQ